jgi:hypothetical protein
MKVYGGVNVEFHDFLISAAVWGEWSASHPSCFISGEKDLSIHWIRGWVGSRTCLDDVEKRKLMIMIQTQMSQSSSLKPVIIQTVPSQPSKHITHQLKFVKDNQFPTIYYWGLLNFSQMNNTIPTKFGKKFNFAYSILNIITLFSTEAVIQKDQCDQK